MNRIGMFVTLACSAFLASLAGCVVPPGGTRPVTTVVCKNTSGICSIPATVTIVNGQCTVVAPDTDADKTVVSFRVTITGSGEAKDVTFVSGPGIQFRDPKGWVVPPTQVGDKRALVFPTAPHKGAKYSINLTNGCVLDPVINNDFDADY